MKWVKKQALSSSYPPDGENTARYGGEFKEHIQTGMWNENIPMDFLSPPPLLLTTSLMLKEEKNSILGFKWL